jgi:hypothetical protein
MTPKWLARLLSVFLVASPTPAPVAPLVLPGVEFHDRRKTAAQSHHGYKTRARKLSKVTGICLHQAACYLGERPARYDTGGAHVFVTRQGRVIWLHDFDRWVCAANGWNDGTISIEIDGLYAGFIGGRVWDNPRTPQREVGMELTPEAARAALQVIEWIRAQVPGVRVIVAHRQASADRPDDPGEAIWKAVALPSGLVMAPSTTLGDGLPLPDEWIA